MNFFLDDIITNIELIENNNLKTKEIERVLEMIDSYKMDDYQLYYLKGYLWNLLPFDSDKREQEVEYNLKKSITLKDDYIYSKTELSFFYFDQKKYSNVIKLLNNIEFSFFEERGQLWKSLKLQELLAVSKLYTTKFVDSDLSNEFLSLISVYLHLPEEEVAVPRELVNSVIENIDKKNIYNIAKNTYSLIKSLSFKDYFDKTISSKLKK